jgi:hypothetical protein
MWNVTVSNALIGSFEERPELQTEQPFALQTGNNEM